eukprot:jgi/Bigna1/80926/fgenesh1_pg.75_\
MRAFGSSRILRISYDLGGMDHLSKKREAFTALRNGWIQIGGCRFESLLYKESTDVWFALSGPGIRTISKDELYRWMGCFSKPKNLLTNPYKLASRLALSCLSKTIRTMEINKWGGGDSSSRNTRRDGAKNGSMTTTAGINGRKYSAETTKGNDDEDEENDNRSNYGEIEEHPDVFVVEDLIVGKKEENEQESGDNLNDIKLDDSNSKGRKSSRVSMTTTTNTNTRNLMTDGCGLISTDLAGKMALQIRQHQQQQ